MDESGNNAQDRFFVLGILLIPPDKIGELFNFLENISSKIKSRSRENIHKRIDGLYKNGDMESILQYAKSTKSFEIKFKSINQENEDLYIHILHKFFKQDMYRFAALVLDKESDDFKYKTSTYWNDYLDNAAILISESLKNINNPEFVIIGDQITQSEKNKPYEIYLSNKINELLKVKPFGIMRAESHSSVFLQLVDIFVGAIGYDCVAQNKERKLKFMKVLRKYLGENFGQNKNIFTFQLSK